MRFVSNQKYRSSWGTVYAMKRWKYGRVFQISVLISDADMTDRRWTARRLRKARRELAEHIRETYETDHRRHVEHR